MPIEYDLPPEPPEPATPVGRGLLGGDHGITDDIDSPVATQETPVEDADEDPVA